MRCLCSVPHQGSFADSCCAISDKFESHVATLTVSCANLDAQVKSLPPPFGRRGVPNPQFGGRWLRACSRSLHALPLRVRYTFIQIGMKLSLFIPKIFIPNHFHPKPLSSSTIFIPHPKPQPQPHTPEPLDPKTLHPKTFSFKWKFKP